jgi:MYXO-CTERM domain-containing protein
MSRALRAVLAAALAAAATPGLAFVRSTTATNPADPAKGLCLYWNTRQVTYRVNATSAKAPPCQSAAAALALTTASFPAWSPSCTDFRFVDGGTTTATALDGQDGVNLVVFRSGTCADAGCSGNACASQHNCWDYDANTIALTTTTFRSQTGEVVDADLELNGWNGSLGGAAGLPTGFYLTCATPSSPTCQRPPYNLTGCNYIDVGNTVTHEAGHMLGLDHTCTYPEPFYSCPVGGTTMDPTMFPGETKKRSLTPDDVNGVCTIYPRGLATVTCSGSTPTPPPASSSGGCSTGGGGSGIAGLLALALLLIRRRPD